jgi:hypothetical protein
MWNYVITDLAGTELGEVRNATARTVSLGLNRASTASFSIRTDNPLVTDLFAGDTLLKVYEDKTLRFHGNVVSTELAGEGDGASIRVNAANPAWKLARRLLGLSTGGKTYTGDKAKSARKMINELNTDTTTYPTNPETGIKLLAESAYTAGSGTYVAGPYRTALSCINDLAHTLTGFDWYISPMEMSAGKYGLFEAEQGFGNSSNAVFEYGWGAKTAKSINYVRDLGDLTNKAYHVPDDLETESVLNEADTASIAYRGRYEAVADAFGITDAGLRAAWLAEFIRVKKNPRFVVSMTLDIDDGSGRIPKLGTDYWLGDFVTARGVLQGTPLFNGLVRVYGIEIEVSEQGSAQVTPVLLDEEGEAL